ncbi:MAG: hypothetical protein F9K45_01525 [Melioribacteraceae bacterium]|nr:MAG: hypothetical protein F9K45_01525 [Melioribacteraceae bacterium]
MKWLNKILLIAFAAVSLQACTAMYVQTIHDDYDSEDQQIIVEQPVIIIIEKPEFYISQPAVIAQPIQETPKTKLRTDGDNNNSQKVERKSNNNESSTRNNSGQRNTISRGK